ncbi:MAG: hypothetical protein OEW12_02050 [Deltaproteobacteria bacterium]|nr:hypothetical protein [Deltaproteobacteria bacterium]
MAENPSGRKKQHVSAEDHPQPHSESNHSVEGGEAPRRERQEVPPVKEGGDLSSADTGGEPTYNPVKHQHETAARIALLLLWILAGTVLLHTGGVIFAEWMHLPGLTSALSEIIKVWLPVLAGLSGSAVAIIFHETDSRNPSMSRIQ